MPRWINWSKYTKRKLLPTHTDTHVLFRVRFKYTLDGICNDLLNDNNWERMNAKAPPIDGALLLSGHPKAMEPSEFVPKVSRPHIGFEFIETHKCQPVTTSDNH